MKFWFSKKRREVPMVFDITPPWYLLRLEKKRAQKKLINFSLKIVAVVLVAALNTTGLLAVSQTAAYYLDLETSGANTLAAGSLDFHLEATEFNRPFNVAAFPPGWEVAKTVDILNDGTLPFQYFAQAENFGGDQDFCDSLDLLDENYVEIGDLNTFISETTTTLSQTLYQLSYPDPEKELENKSCTFDIAYKGRQTMYIPSYGDGGFADIEVVPNQIDSWGVRINKVYFTVAEERGEEVLNEWVELYNQTDRPIDLTGWSLCDNNTCDDLPDFQDPIGPQKYALVSASTSTWPFWTIPSNIKKGVVSDGAIGDGLDNENDLLELRRPDGFVVDEVSWNGDEEGEVISRLPKGYDTNTPEDWKDLSFPVVNLIDPDQSGELTWYWTYTYDINWEAQNQNGNDSKLKVDLYYIKDLDYNEEISAEDSVHPIASNLANDGHYEWTVPSGFLGHIWIKIVVRGPENPMMHTQVISGKIYDPFPLELWEENPDEVVDSLLIPEVIEEEVVEEPKEVVEEVIEEENSEEVIEEIEEVVEEAEVVEEDEEAIVVEEAVEEEPIEDEPRPEVPFVPLTSTVSSGPIESYEKKEIEEEPEVVEEAEVVEEDEETIIVEEEPVIEPIVEEESEEVVIEELPVVEVEPESGEVIQEPQPEPQPEPEPTPEPEIIPEPAPEPPPQPEPLPIIEIEETVE